MSVVDHKKGEVNELKTMLRNPKFARDQVKMREILKKVIAYMTIGIDVSRLFSEVVMAASTKDLVQKKLVYLYLSNYAKQNADLALLAINTLTKDCQDEDPMVRGLALRSLCSLRLPNILEYLMAPIRNGLKDPSPYVRKTAALGCAKVFRLSPSTVKDSELVDALYNLLRDRDVPVITNALHALNEILESEGGMTLNTAIIIHLLNRFRDMSEWAQCGVLNLVARFKPANEDQMFDIMNLLEEKIKHSNSAVVMGITNVFLKFTESQPEIHKQVYQRLKAPLLTLMAGGQTELQYALLSHFLILAQREPGVFDDAYKSFYVRFNDPTCVKLQKVSLLTHLSNTSNAQDIINELAEYVTDVDADVARSSIRAISRVALRHGGSVDTALEHLMSFLDLSNDYVTAETCIVCKDLLRKYPDRYEEVIPALQKCLASIEEPEGKAAVVWMVGEYGDTIRDAPYMLEPLIDNFDEEVSPAVRIELLTATMKLFFKRPPELQAMLGRLLTRATNDPRVDVRDRARLYFQLLKFNVFEAARVVNCPKLAVDTFMESSSAAQARVYHEFNSLSVLYGQPAERFIRASDRGGRTVLDEDDEPHAEADQPTDQLIEEEAAAAVASPPVEEPAAPALPVSVAVPAAAPAPVEPAPVVSSVMDFLSGDILGTPAAPAAAPPALTLSRTPSLDPASFQNQWRSLSAAAGSPFELTVAPAVVSRLEKALNAIHIITIASGTVNQAAKAYLYAQDSTTTFLVEMVGSLTTGKVVVTVKATNPSLVQQFRELVTDCLRATK